MNRDAEFCTPQAQALISMSTFETDHVAAIQADYPGAVYDKENDQFIYKGLRFDYFTAGVRMDFEDYGAITSRHGYVLVDERSGEWLSFLGDEEENWANFCQRLVNSGCYNDSLHLLGYQEPYTDIKKPDLFTRIFKWLDKKANPHETSGSDISHY